MYSPAVYAALLLDLVDVIRLKGFTRRTRPARPVFGTPISKIYRDFRRNSARNRGISKMVSSKSLFLGVYASSGLIRLLFLPLCYLFLASPFLLLALRYLKVYQKVPEIVPKEYSASDIGLPIIFTVVWTCIATRFLSNRNNVSIKHDGKRRVQFLPYWIPALRHWGNVTFGGEGWLKGVR